MQPVHIEEMRLVGSVQQDRSVIDRRRLAVEGIGLLVRRLYAEVGFRWIEGGQGEDLGGDGSEESDGVGMFQTEVFVYASDKERERISAKPHPEPEHE